MPIPEPNPRPGARPITEASIAIEGVELTFAESMTVRVALSTLSIALSDEPTLASLYLVHLRALCRLIAKGAK